MKPYNYTVCTNDVTTAVSEVLATANRNRSQITCYGLNGVFITFNPVIEW